MRQELVCIVGVAALSLASTGWSAPSASTVDAPLVQERCFEIPRPTPRGGISMRSTSMAQGKAQAPTSGALGGQGVATYSTRGMAKSSSRTQDAAVESSLPPQAAPPTPSPFVSGDGVGGAADVGPSALDIAPDGKGASVDFGATVHLSNDDSMSLASAQRVLAALEKGYDIPVEHVRPHELLNYFSFETAPVLSGDLFSVAPSVVEQGDRLRLALAVQGGATERHPLDLTLVLDRSGSMSSDQRMAYTKRALQLMVDQLVRGDRVDLVLFDHNVCTPLKNFVVGRDDIGLLKETINLVKPRGSTDLDSGLRHAYEIQTERPNAVDRNRRVMLLTDALLNTGNVDMDLVADVGKAFDDHGIRLTGVGVGSDFNDTMLNRLTEKGKGAYVFLGSEAVVDRLFGAGFQSLVQTIAHNVRFSLDLPRNLAMERFYGEESSVDPEDVQPIHYYADTSQMFLQDLISKPGLKTGDELVFQIRWEDADSGASRTENHVFTVGALRRADARNANKAVALMEWSDRLLDYAMSEDCGDGFASFHIASERLSDGELDYVAKLLSDRCPVVETPARPSFQQGITLKVSIDSDVPITEVALLCSDTQRVEKVSGSDQVARFGGLGSGGCQLELRGGVPLRAPVDIPNTDASATCRVRSGRITCTR